jgi:hypothetical protein
MADASNQCGVTLGGQQGNGRVAFGPIGCGHAHLEELMVGKGTPRLGNDCRGDSRIADLDDGVQVMRQPLQVAALFFGELHLCIVAISGRRSGQVASWALKGALDALMNPVPR